MELATRTIEEHTIEPPAANSHVGVNPTEIRYGWIPFKKIWLLGPDGRPNPHVQPYHKAGPDGQPVRNELFSELPKGQLIPFASFELIEQSPSQEQRMTDGRPMLVSQPRTQSALDCVVLLSRVYAEQGFTILASLQGLDQPTANRIFRVVQPFNYPIKDAPEELANAGPRIEATEDIVFHFDDRDYVVPCLKDAREREIAYKLRDEMVDGAEFARLKATDQLNATEMSMVNRASGGFGKTGADPHDEYLCKELERGLPQIIGEKKADLSVLEAKLDFVVGREKQREAQEEIEQLRAEIEALKNAEPQALVCGAPKSDGSPCQTLVRSQGERCSSHRVKEEVATELENAA